MEIYCKTCDKILGDYPDEKIPPNVKGHTTCKTCGEKIELFRKEDASADVSRAEPPASSFDEMVLSHPVLSDKKDRGAIKEDFMALAIGILILFATAFIYKPDFSPSRFSPAKLQAEIMTEMMKNPQGQGEELQESFPEIKELEEAMKDFESEMEQK